MKILIYNINAASGISKGYYEFITKFWRFLFFKRKTANQICATIMEEKPDIAYLIETRKGKLINEYKYICEKIKYPHCFFFTKYNPKLKYIPYIHNNGCSLFSKIDFKEQKGTFNKGFLKKAYIKLSIKNNLSIYLFHFPLGKKTRKEQFCEIKEVIKKDKKKIILLGDFNTFGGPDEIKDIIKECKLKNPNVTDKKTYPSWKPKKTLDYILVSKKIPVKSFKIIDTHLSDHLPLIIEI
jgi:endonuclease/exonuclease/phosphatase (EEP) superfamily protein YafD